MVSVTGTDFMWFVDTALDAMAVILRDLGDDLANRQPDLEGANTPFAILTHCLGVMEFWGGATVAGREIQRDREAEFRARGELGDLLRRAAAARQQLESDLAELDSEAAPLSPGRHAKPDDAPDAAEPYARNRGSVLLHIVEELFQHLGQMELTRDLLLADG
jgi:hypothetical protein